MSRTIESQLLQLAKHKRVIDGSTCPVCSAKKGEVCVYKWAIPDFPPARPHWHRTDSYWNNYWNKRGRKNGRTKGREEGPEDRPEQEVV
jgi:hypothetical protein